LRFEIDSQPIITYNEDLLESRDITVPYKLPLSKRTVSKAASKF